jgi:hypothetical protein
LIVDSHQRDHPPGDEDGDRRETDKAFGANAARSRGREANA